MAKLYIRTQESQGHVYFDRTTDCMIYSLLHLRKSTTQDVYGVFECTQSCTNPPMQNQNGMKFCFHFGVYMYNQLID